MEAVIARWRQRQWPMLRNISNVALAVAHLTEYAVLSHRWSSKRELSLEDIGELSKRAEKYHPSEKGDHYDKIIQYSHKSLEYGCHYAWFDTGCINQYSSSELEESIEAMFYWYHNAAVCIVHLGSTHDPKTMERDEWFKRGWTLQELLASRRMKFFTADWRNVTPERFDITRTNEVCYTCAVTTATAPTQGPDGNSLRRHEQKYQMISSDDLFDKIVHATGIEANTLRSFVPDVRRARSVISWMAGRTTRRPEDRAYCLLGLLDLPMPLAYGEGFEQAFFRLQVETLKQSDDRGIFLWEDRPSSRNSMFTRSPSILAKIPLLPGDSLVADVLYRGNSMDEDDIDQSLPLNNMGLRIQVVLYDIRRIDLRHAQEGCLTLIPERPLLRISGDASWKLRDSNYLSKVVHSQECGRNVKFEHVEEEEKFVVEAPSITWDSDRGAKLTQVQFKKALERFKRFKSDMPGIAEELLGYIDQRKELPQSALDRFKLEVLRIQPSGDKESPQEVETPHLKIAILGSTQSSLASNTDHEILWAVALQKDAARVPARYSRIAAIKPFSILWPKKVPLKRPERIYIN
ncbi:hypothetical protein HGRIS_005694 [Hohenbuehelia grisea]|uniref:Heterokaryon incompatibility domain-containing protein n=1 Tax=Hohenbuehelia grisea TaxID=104357 RepID=A0ABR3JXK9_9AGAR